VGSSQHQGPEFAHTRDSCKERKGSDLILRIKVEEKNSENAENGGQNIDRAIDLGLQKSDGDKHAGLAVHSRGEDGTKSRDRRVS